QREHRLLHHSSPLTDGLALPPTRGGVPFRTPAPPHRRRHPPRHEQGLQGGVEQADRGMTPPLTQTTSTAPRATALATASNPPPAGTCRRSAAARRTTATASTRAPNGAHQPEGGLRPRHGLEGVDAAQRPDAGGEEAGPLPPAEGDSRAAPGAARVARRRRK